MASLQVGIYINSVIFYYCKFIFAGDEDLGTLTANIVMSEKLQKSVYTEEPTIKDHVSTLIAMFMQSKIDKTDILSSMGNWVMMSHPLNKSF